MDNPFQGEVIINSILDGDKAAFFTVFKLLTGVNLDGISDDDLKLIQDKIIIGHRISTYTFSVNEDTDPNYIIDLKESLGYKLVCSAFLKSNINTLVFASYDT